MSSQLPAPGSPLLFGDSRPTARVTNHTTVGHTSLSFHKSPEEKTARDLLRDVQEDDELESGRKRSGALRMFGRRSPSMQESGQPDNPVSKHYMKMGILIRDEGDVSRDGGRSGVYEGRSGVSQSLSTDSRLCHTPRKTHTLHSSSPGLRHTFVTEGGGERNEGATPVEARPVCRVRTNSSGYEMVDIESNEEERGVVAQPSPPISVKSGSSSNTVHSMDLLTSSPDSGYGNTPEYINAARSADPEVKGEQHTRKAANEATAVERVREETDKVVFRMDSGGDSPHVEGTDRRNLIRHAHSVPGNMAAVSQPPLPLPETIPEGAAPFPFLMSLAPGQLSVNGIETGSAVDLTEMEKQLERRAHHHVNPSQPTPHPKVLGPTSSVPLSQSTVVGGNAGKKKVRALSQPFTAMSDIQAVQQVKAGTMPPTHPNTKDYFQVTDELSKENSHFALSEALLGVIELYKANCDEQQLLENSSPPDSPSLSFQGAMKGLIPLGGRHYISNSPGTNSLDESGSFFQGSPVSSLSSLGLSSASVSSVGAPSLSSVGAPSVSVEFGRSQSEVALNRHTPRSSHQSVLELMQSPMWDNSAESTAQKLLLHMTGHMTKTSVGNSQMAVQVPTEFLTLLKRDEDLQKSLTRSSAHMRGNREWAPPRKQIIYSIKQPSRNLQKDLAAQGYRCTGCGMKVNPTYVRYFRFCNYTGKYFCQNCHMNATSLIPAYILERWSFKRLYVSNFARDLLAKIHSEPVFTVPSSFYSKSPLMAQAKDLRVQLISVKQYLHTCRSSFAQQLNLSFQGYAPWTVDLQTYSIEDFVEIKSGNKMKYLRAMLADGIAHIKSCPLCMGKGFVCELCDDSDVIFPFESNKVSTCRDCRCCFHKTCYSPTSQCPRCHRMHLRLKQRAKAAEGATPPTRNSSERPS